MPLKGREDVRPGRGLKRLIDLIAYVAIAVLFFVALAALAVHDARTHEDHDPGKWIGLVLVTAIVFGDALRTARGHHDRRLWVVIAIFFAAQCGLGVLVVANIDSIPAVAWVIILPLDYWALEGFVRLFVPDRRSY
jgi:hypothetical protein